MNNWFLYVLYAIVGLVLGIPYAYLAGTESSDVYVLCFMASPVVAYALVTMFQCAWVEDELPISVS